MSGSPSSRVGGPLSVWMSLVCSCYPSQGLTYDRPAGHPSQSRSVVVARHAMVATSHPLAAQAGLDVLQAGGNAADAAITTCAMLGVVEPMSCGIGGDLFAIYWDHETQKLYGLNASGRSPHAISRQEILDRGLREIPDEGPLSWSVPGCVSGWEALRNRFGTWNLSQLLSPAITTARQGFPVSEIVAAGWQGSVAALQRWPDSAATYLIDGRAPRFGEVFQNRRLAASLQQIAEGGAAAFYHGPIAKKIAAFSRSHDGYLSEQDFSDHSAEWVDPVSASYRGYEVWELPPNGQGIAALQMLNILKGFDIASMGPGSPQYLHLLIEAKRLAFADRARYYADPARADVPVNALLSEAYAARQRARIRRDRAAPSAPPGDPRLRHADTVYLTVVDNQRNCCSMIQSIYYSFGSQVVPGDVGFAMQNRGALFALEDEHPNRLEPHKRPFHTIIPAMVTRRGQPWLVFGVMGGDMQPQGHVQVLINLIDFGMNVQLAGDAARVRHYGSATPTGRPEAGKGRVVVESGISDETIASLEALGHQVERGRGGFGGYQAILVDDEHGTLHGGSEPRKDGAAVGY